MNVEGTIRSGDEKILPSLPSDHHFLERGQGTDTPQSESSPTHSSSPLLHTWPREDPSSSQWWAEGGRRERLYQDRRGGLHVAHQPPGYTDDHDDSHPSESLSDHDQHPHHHSGDTSRPSARPWTSSGSESAYETIRERHRHVDEALASSFEFYSTSPRDARLLGYVSSEGKVCTCLCVCMHVCLHVSWPKIKGKHFQDPGALDMPLVPQHCASLVFWRIQVQILKGQFL